MSDLTFETLIKANEKETRWYPHPVGDYEKALKLDDRFENVYALRKNLAYSLQYMEFLEKELKELRLSSVLCTMIYKTYVITGMSILEGLFTNIIKSHNWWNKDNQESLGSVKTSQQEFHGEKYIVSTEIFRIVDEFDKRMDLEAMIRKLDSHHDALEVDHRIYPALKRIKQLRNRVHLQKAENETDHDYNAFDNEVKEEMGEILYEILTAPAVSDNPELFEFLKVNCRE